MDHYRATKATIHLGAITRNTKRILHKYPGYDYYMAVVKADCYGYRGMDVVQSMVDGGANCLAASLLEEGLLLREHFPSLPILLFTPLDERCLSICAEKKIWATVATEADALKAAKVHGLSVAVRCNGGSDIFGGPTDRDGFQKIWNILLNGNCVIKGLYLHSYNAEIPDDTQQEYEIFEAMTSGIDLNKLEFVSVSNSLSLPRYDKKTYCNACRLGNILYGIESEDDQLEETFQLTTKVHSVFTLKKGQSVAYGHAYTAPEDNTCIAALPIGFGDGFSKINIGRSVYIGDKAYPIVAVTMDITHILVDPSVHPQDLVYLIRDNRHLEDISSHIHGATEEPICALNKRIHREYIKS